MTETERAIWIATYAACIAQPHGVRDVRDAASAAIRARESVEHFRALVVTQPGALVGDATLQYTRAVAGADTPDAPAQDDARTVEVRVPLIVWADGQAEFLPLPTPTPRPDCDRYHHATLRAHVPLPPEPVEVTAELASPE